MSTTEDASNPISHDDLVLLTRYMADNGSTADEIASAVEKPWHFPDELAAARAEAN